MNPLLSQRDAARLLALSTRTLAIITRPDTTGAASVIDDFSCICSLHFCGVFDFLDHYEQKGPIVCGPLRLVSQRLQPWLYPAHP
jgi:hypothetical protein